jgi:hypothetical protein
VDAASFLSSVIDIAIGVAGFAGIVAAVRQRKLSHWPIEQLLLLQILFTATAASIFFGLLPSFLTESGLDENTVWKVSSGALVCWIVGAIAFRISQSRKHRVAMPIPGHIRVLGVIAVGLQIYNMTGMGRSWPYLFGIMTILINAFSVFLILVLKPIEQENPPNKSLETDA